MKWFSRVVLLVLLALVCGALVEMCRAGVHVACEPSFQVASVGDTVQIAVTVPIPGDVWNGYWLEVTWDPAALSLVDHSEGPYLLEPCGVTFWVSEASAGLLDVGHAIWCQGVFVPGPGELFVMRFRVLGSGMWFVRLESVAFYAGGPVVPVSSVTHGTVDVAGPPSDVRPVAFRTWGAVRGLYVGGDR